jgi:hypothetical protein
MNGSSFPGASRIRPVIFIFTFKFKVVAVPSSEVLMPSVSGVSHRRFRSLFVGSVAAAAAILMLSAFRPTVANAQKPKKSVAVRCDGAAGWSGAVGVPSQLAKNGPLGLYVWNQKGIWRVTATGPERKLRLFQGTVTFDAPVTVKPFGLEGRSDSAVAGENSVAFTFKNFGQRDGIGVEAPCATSVTLTGTIDGVALAPTQVFVGSAGSPASVLPLVLRKDAPAPPSTVLTDTVASACPTNAWASNTVGRPNGLKKFKSRALHVWFENGRWQFFATDAGRPQVIEGRITFNAPVTVKGSTNPEVLRVEPRFDGSSVVFSFKNGEMPDGFTVASPCAGQMTIEAVADEVALPTTSLLVGPGSAPATAMPFVIAR